MRTKTQILTFLGGTLAAIALSAGTASAQSVDQSSENTAESNLQLAQQPNPAKPAPSTNQSGCACCKTMKEDMKKMRQQMEIMKKPGNSMPGMNHSGTAQ